MDQTELCYLSAQDLLRRYQRRELSPVEVTEAVLERIEQLEPQLNAYVTVTVDLAMEQARIAESMYQERADIPPLLGVPTSLKDLTPTAGIRTTRGSLLYENWVPDYNAPFAERLFEAGVVMLGKTNTPELGHKGETSNRVSGTTHNPWQQGKTPGGSSGGASAAVAAGMGQLAQGSDGGGSIRIPASFTGIYGFKQSWGLVPQFPPSAAQFLAHNGPMTRTVADAALMLDVMAGADARDQYSWSSGIHYLDALEDTEVQGMKVAFSPNLGYGDVAPDVANAVRTAALKFEELGCVVEEVNPGIPDPEGMFLVMWGAIMAGAFADNFDEARELLSPGLVSLIEHAQQYSGVDVMRTATQRNDYYTAMREFMANYDLLITPTTPITAFEVETEYFEGGEKPHHFTCPFNLTGQPAASIPCGFDSSGLPIGMQIVGQWHDDVSVLRASAAFEQIAPWTDARPALD